MKGPLEKDCIYQGCQWEVIKNVELHFVLSLCVSSTRVMPQGGQDRSSKGAEGEEHRRYQKDSRRGGFGGHSPMLVSEWPVLYLA